ncbi:ATP-binding protein [Dankookia sp. GCM10030260]|uniref:GAF domain-containing sensor histidine kinase n=1 Tax=Dankookia sp. GCM10030260 TaxID=3273390 RepID=UPI00360EF8A8
MDTERDTAADIALIQRISAVPTILQLLCETTGLGFAAVARVTDEAWTACAVLDRVGFGLQPGSTLELTTTFCQGICRTRTPVIFDHASTDADFRDHPTPKLYGFESYISVPIIRRDGSVFGTICGLDPKPVPLRGGKVLPVLTLFAELVAAQLEIEERLDASRTALLDAEAMGALREQFIAVLGHDLRNPLAAVSAGVTLLARRPQDDRTPAILGRMRQSCRRMAALVDDILDFARGRLGGGIAVRRDLVALAAPLHEVVDELRSVHPTRDIRAEIALPDPVRCDPRRIAQLLSNLLANALTHGAPDRPVRVTARGTAGGLTLAVANEGPPIPPGTRARLFQPFSRDADGPRAGLGLGLYIAAEIARSHGGTLGVVSDAAGTAFTLDLPPG